MSVCVIEDVVVELCVLAQFLSLLRIVQKCSLAPWGRGIFLSLGE